MVEINNQRKGVPRYAGVVGGELITDVRKTNHGYDVIVGELFTDYSDHILDLCALNPKLQINRRRTLPTAPVGGILTAAAWPERLLSEKSRDAVALQQIKERGALPMIDRGDIRQAIDVTLNIWASLPGAGYGQFEHKADSLIAKIQRSGRNGPERLMYGRVTAIISALVICIIVCLSWAVNHYRDNAITYKASATKYRELKLAGAAITDNTDAST